MAPKTKTKDGKKKTAAVVEAPKPVKWLITINQQSYRYADPYYHVSDVSRSAAIVRAIAFHGEKHPTNQIETIKVEKDAGDHYFVPDVAAG